MKHLMVGLLACTALAGCGGEEQFTEQAQSERIQVNVEKVLGAWKSEDGKSGFEFHGAPTKYAILDEDTVVDARHFQKEGIMYKHSVPYYHFIWTLSALGDIIIQRKDNECQLRPLTFCPTLSREQITLKGNTYNNIVFDIAKDIDLDGVYDNYESMTLTKKKLVDFPITDKTYFVETGHYRSGSQYSASTASGQLKVSIPYLANEHLMVETGRTDYSIELAFDAGVQVEIVDFELIGQEHFEPIEVSYAYENLLIYPAFDDSYVFSHTINRQLLVPDNFPVDRLEIGSFDESLNNAIRFNIYNEIIDVPVLNFGQDYHTMLLEVFDQDELSGQAGNQLKIFENGTATLAFPDLMGTLATTEEVFTWQIPDDRKSLILTNDRRRLTMEFISDEGDSYKYIYSNYSFVDQEYLIKGDLETLFTRNITVDLNTLLPGNFDFISPNSVMIYPVTLDENFDTEIVGIGEIEGGKWRIDENGDLIRYECFSLSGVKIQAFDRCVESFQYVGTEDSFTTYSHISRLKFLHKLGDNRYMVKYDALFWGGRFDFVQTLGRLGTYYIYHYIPQ